MCASLGSRQRAQDTSVGAAAFHWERRCRVLERDVFRLGTATSVVLVFVVRVAAHWFVVLFVCEQRPERGPPRI